MDTKHEEEMYERIREEIRAQQEDPKEQRGGVTYNFNFYGQLDVGTVTAIRMIAQALKESDPQKPPSLTRVK